MVDVTLDTCVIVNLIRKQRGTAAVLGTFVSPGFSHIVFGELLLGSMKSTRPLEKNRVFQALEGISVLNADASTAEIYARLCWRLENRGLPIPQNDLWIAAASIQADVPLITRDRHFSPFPSSPSCPIKGPTFSLAPSPAPALIDPHLMEAVQNKESTKEFQLHDKDTGSADVQIAQLTHRINDLTKHLQKFKKDHSSRRGLLMMVAQRKKLQDYLKKSDSSRYDKVIQKLNLRK